MHLVALLAVSVAAVAPDARASDGPSDTNAPFADRSTGVDQSPLDEGAQPGRSPECPGDHKALSLGIVGGTYGFLWGFTYLAWYLNSEGSPSFHFNDEGWFGMDTYAGGADKMGHVWGNYAVVRGVSGILEWGGWGKTMSLLTATGLTTGFFVTTEIEDGYRQQYGFAWNDIAMNLTGSVLAVLMEVSPPLDRRFDFRLEYFPSKPFRESVAENGPFNSPEDYTGQRFFLAYHLSTIDPMRESDVLFWTQYLDLSLGFHAAHFKPEEKEPVDHAQDLFVGVTVNVQQILDNTVMTGPRSTGGRVIGFTNEIYQLPYTTLRLGGVSRSEPAGTP